VLSLLAQVARPILPWGWGFAELAIAVIIIAGIVAIAWVILVKAMGITPPPWFVNVLWIVLAVFVGILAIRIIASL
jgi:uncharacterized protein (DUF983 family)